MERLILRPRERVLVTLVCAAPCSRGHMMMAAPLRIVNPSLMGWRGQKLARMSLLFLFDVSHIMHYCCFSRDIKICCQIKKSLPSNFLQQKLLNKWARPWFALMITQQHNCIKLLTQRWCTTSCSSMSGNYCLVWFTLMQPGCERRDNCGAKCCSGWQDPFLDLSRAAVIERAVPGSTHTHIHTHTHTHTHTQADELICTNTCAHMWAHTHTQREAKSATLHIEMIVSCLCQVVLFFSSHETSSWEIEQFLIENSAGN